MSSVRKTFPERRLQSFCRRAYNFSRDVQEVIDCLTPLEARKYELTLRVLHDGSLELYYQCLDAMRRYCLNED